MGVLGQLYRCPLTLLTDLYQLTMAQGYWRLGMQQRQAAFSLTFRENPFGGGYAIACGLNYAIEYVEGVRFGESELAYLASLEGNDGRALFERPFLEYLAALRWTVDIDAVPEGTVVFAHEPMLRVTGPILQCQLLETPLLNMVNFQTLIATKAARVCQAARGEPVLEFGLRRAQGIDGALAAARAAYVGGCAATSNVLAGKLFGIPVRGTHAHSWVMAFDDELEAFEAYARAMPNNCIFLVDTYDSLEGVRRAVQVGRKLRERGHQMVGIRLDSGDLAHLSVEARKMLDAAGFIDAVIVASNELDEQLIESLKARGAAICVWGVGTKLVTAHGQPALGGVYKLTAIRDETGQWRDRLKLSEGGAKTSAPGLHQVRRFRRGEVFIADMIYDIRHPPAGEAKLVDLQDPTRRRVLPGDAAHEDLLVPIFREGERVYDPPPLDEARRRAQDQLGRLHAGIKRLAEPQHFLVGLEEGLFQRKRELTRRTRRQAGGEERR